MLVQEDPDIRPPRTRGDEPMPPELIEALTPSSPQKVRTLETLNLKIKILLDFLKNGFCFQVRTKRYELLFGNLEFRETIDP